MEGTRELSGYPKIFNLGHRHVANIFDGPVVIQEKIDGSQFSWGVDTVTGKLLIRSKKQAIDPLDPPKLFAPSVASVWRMFEEGRLHLGWTYRGEAMSAPRHNTLCYDRAPVGNIVLFDIQCNDGTPVTSQQELGNVARVLGIESVVVLGHGEVKEREQFEDLLQLKSQLGGMIEGMVIKNYALSNPFDGGVLMAKYVAPKFRELHTGNPTYQKEDIVQRIAQAVCPPARWEKAIMRFRESGILDGSPKDIGPLMKEIQEDVEAEGYYTMVDMLLKHFKRQIMKRCVSGFPEWYKERLLTQQFDG